MACALVGAKLGIRVGHVEAGLRSFDRTMPEEINRVVTDSVSDLLFVSEPAGRENLAREGIPNERVQYVGNVMIDSLVEQLPAARALRVPERNGLSPGGYAVVTLHRPSNVDSKERLRSLIGLLVDVARELPIVFPIHPRTQKKIDEHGLRDAIAAHPRIKLCGPLGYREFLGAVADARVVVTDSGGIQEETTYLGIPCITLRANTERPITVSHGTNTLVGDDTEAAWQCLRNALASEYKLPRQIDGWDGRAASRIVALLRDWSRLVVICTRRCPRRLSSNRFGIRIHVARTSSRAMATSTRSFSPATIAFAIPSRATSRAALTRSDLKIKRH
jgi:UDP-N-acetylglucosamine 2-epimerase (non-hydrolysing)